ncbi:MAG: succinate dehydrogenase cytochrome b subunit [Verrucomicrobia bacterium]|nr:succinate dehydrogenase cytochrome b subunit [Verrucomicrobiota bacterium]MBI3868839.1 succinate dehydrogenase cytochrome b subunit [Verrucomicrobiota bacterium]
MKVITRLWRSSLGKKYLMALSGIALWVFVIGHLLGNLQVFLGPEKINGYAHFLKSQAGLLWGSRLGLLAMVVLHVASAISLSRQNRAARPIDYGAGAPPLAASYASRTMLMSGLIVAFFIVYHLLHYTLIVPAVNLQGVDFATYQRKLADNSETPDVYRMMIVGFRHPAVAASYVIAVGLLCLHLSHGLSSMFQSLGITRFSREGRDCFARGVGLLLFLGYCSIPISILLGFGKEVVK